MFHPLEEDLSKLSDSEVENRVQELSRKYFTAQRLGKPEMLTQLATFVTIYKEEMSKRYREKTKTELGGDLDQLINVNN
jgi:ribosomal protein L29